MSDVWVGLAVLAAYLLVWNLVLPITLWTWILPLGLAVWTFVRWRPGSPSFDRRAAVVLGGVAVVWAVLADQALGPSKDYDFGLYHLDLITYAKHYATIPGLANLHSRLGAGDAHLLLTAFIDQHPLAGAGPHLVDGFLVSLLVLDAGLRLARPGSGAPSFSRRLAVLVVPVVIAVVMGSPQGLLSSPNLDVAAFVEVCIGMVYFAQSIELDFAATPALTATAALALASATRPLYWPLTLFAAGFFVFGRRGRPRALRSATVVIAIPLTIGAGWVARQAILSGYPLYPLTMLGLPTDWRVPASVMTAANRGDDAWARWPGVDPNVVLASWTWLHAWWFRQSHALDVILPLVLVASVLPSVAAVGVHDPDRRRRLRPMLAVAVPCALLLVPWFLTAPDPRFAFALICLVPASLAAWALPALGSPSVRWWAGVAGLAAVGVVALAWFARVDRQWLVPVAIAGWGIAGAAGVFARRQAVARGLAWGAALSVALAAVAIVWHSANPKLERANGHGPLGVPLPAPPGLMTIVTTSGLQLSQPVNGGDQCWQVLLCVPLLVDRNLHLRTTNVQAGFSVRG
jgi:hypothetical protein